MTLPDGWTDDMNIRIAPHRTLDELVDYILQAAVRHDDSSTIIAALTKDFAVSGEDAALALDRACGGAVRAATGNPENCPSQQKDPIAWLSFRRCTRDSSIIAAIYPQFSSATRKISSPQF